MPRLIWAEQPGWRREEERPGTDKVKSKGHTVTREERVRTGDERMGGTGRPTSVGSRRSKFPISASADVMIWEECPAGEVSLLDGVVEVLDCVVGLAALRKAVSAVTT